MKRKSEKEIEKEVLKKLFLQTRNRIAHSKKRNEEDIIEIRKILRKLSRLR